MAFAPTASPTDMDAAFAQAHLLIVDDEPSNRLMLREVCAQLGVGHIYEADDGTTALEIIERAKPDLLILDILMPQMDGITLMQRLRTNPASASLSILVQTILAHAEDRVRCFNAGATDVISRPFHLAELKARIRAHLRSAMATRMLTDFRNRIQTHIDITHNFLDAILPTPEEARERTEAYGLDCSFFLRPHDEVGGDFWVLRRIDDDHLAIVLVDAIAHGLAGAINALRVDCLVQEYYDHLQAPGLFLNKLDAAMAKISFGQLFAGAFAMVFHRQTGVVQFAGSGIPAPLLRVGSTVQELKTSGLPLGSGMLALNTSSATMLPGSTLLLFSDGWSDNLSTPPAQMLAEASLDSSDLALRLAGPGPFSDDLTLIALQRR